MTQYQDILYDVQGRVGVITLNRPDKLNAWTPAMQTSIKRAVHAAAADSGVRVIVVTGAGRGFCAGADMGGLQQITPERWNERESARADDGLDVPLSPHLGPDVSAHYGGRFGYLMSVPKPIVAAINGPCAGIGLVFTLYCDIRFAAADAKFTTAFAQRGLIAEHGISWLLPRIAGIANSLDLLMSARKFDGAQAERLNVVNRSFAREELLPAAMAYAKQLADTVSPRSLAVMKAQIWKGLFQSLGEAIEVGDVEMQRSFATEDFKEGVAHFVEKRAPHFTGK